MKLVCAQIFFQRVTAKVRSILKAVRVPVEMSFERGKSIWASAKKDSYIYHLFVKSSGQLICNIVFTLGRFVTLTLTQKYAQIYPFHHHVV